jgi:hypothetical protein
MKGPYHRKVLGVILSFLPVLTFASSWHAYLGGDGGTSIANIGNPNPDITYYNDQISDTYPLNNRTDMVGMWGLNAGLTHVGSGAFPTIGLGLGFYEIAPSNQIGQVNEAIGSDSQTLYDYQFRLTSYSLMAEIKLSWELANHLEPLLEVGIGPAWNQIKDYSETVAPANTNGYVALSPFQSKTNRDLAYQIGMGIGYVYDQNHISVEYRYVDLGNISTNTRGTEYPYALNFGDLTTQEVFLNFTHVF